MKSDAATVDEYLETLPEDRREIVVALRQEIHTHAPGLTESMEYGMPTFSSHKPRLALASQKHYLALYVMPKGLFAKHKEALKGLNCGKGCIRFTRLEQLPMDAIRDMITYSASN